MRYFFAFLATVGLIIIVIVLLLSGGGGGGNKPTKVAPKKQLADYANTSAQVSMTVDGTINANILHEQIQVLVNQDKVTFKHINGYDGKVVEERSFENTTNAYSSFLSAIQLAGFNEGAEEKLSEAGVCALGKRYIFEIEQDNKILQKYWATSCGEPKTYLGNLDQTITLFRLQVPGFEQLMQNVTLEDV